MLNDVVYDIYNLEDELVKFGVGEASLNNNNNASRYVVHFLFPVIFLFCFSA